MGGKVGVVEVRADGAVAFVWHFERKLPSFLDVEVEGWTEVVWFVWDLVVRRWKLKMVWSKVSRMSLWLR